MTYQEGTCYELPATVTWQTLADARARYGIPANMTLVSHVPGVYAWGRLLPSDYHVLTDSWWTVIDQDGYQRGYFLSRTAAEEYLDGAPHFIVREKSRVKEIPA